MEILKSIFSDVHFIGAILAIIIIIFIGFILRRKNIFTDESKKTLITLLMKISLPCMAFNAFMVNFETSSFLDSLKIFIISLFLYLVFIFLGKLIFIRLPKEKRNVYSIFISLGQVTLISLPLIKSIYSSNYSEVMIPGNMLTLSFRLILYTYAFFVVSRIQLTKNEIHKSLKNIFTNPIMICMILGLIIWISQPIMPKVTIGEESYSIFRIDKTLAPLYYFVKLLDATVTPLSMILVGVTLGSGNLKEAFSDKMAWIISSFKTFLCPLFVLGIAVLLHLTKLITFNEYSLVTLVITFAAPLSAVLNAYCVTYDNHQTLSSRICLLSTFECVIFIPFFIIIIKLIISTPLFN